MAPEQQNTPKEAPIDAPKDLKVKALNPEDPAYKEAERKHDEAKIGVIEATKLDLAGLGREFQPSESGEDIQTMPVDTPEDTGGAEEGEASSTENSDGEAEGEDTTPHTMPEDTPEDTQKA